VIKINNLFKFLNKNRINFFSGVPDSILKTTKNYLESKKKYKHISTCNEGSAVATAIGYHLSTKKLPCVYMQNSGLGNAINPLISIAHKKVYAIPMLLMIGWRGSPGSKDEPQHLAKGSITIKLLNLLKIKYCIINSEKDFNKLKTVINYSKKNKSIGAFLVKKNTFASDVNLKEKKNKKGILRENFTKLLLENISYKTSIISTTGYASRELHQVRKEYKLKKGKDFYMVGGMGHSSMVSLGYSLFTKKQVICLDGDGSVMMHMGSLGNIGNLANKNYKHIILNNFGHESVGGQKTFSEKINFKQVSKGMGYKKYFYLKNIKNIKKIIKSFMASNGPSLLEVIVLQKSMKNLSRPKNLYKIKSQFMNN